MHMYLPPKKYILNVEKVMNKNFGRYISILNICKSSFAKI
jgi:hypothetical protein